MLRGLYSAASGMEAARVKLDIISANIANADTVGYKSTEAVFASMEDLMISKKSGMPVGPLGTGVRIQNTYTDLTQGPLIKTGSKYDLAISGAGFFVVDTGEEHIYSRNGSFYLDAEGYLITNEGYRVLGEDGYIVIGDDFIVSEDAMIETGGLLIDKLMLVEFSNPETLNKVGSGYFVNSGGEEIYSSSSKVRQGYLEGSNVTTLKGMVEMITAVRSYEAATKCIKAYDETLGKAVSEIAQI